MFLRNAHECAINAHREDACWKEFRRDVDARRRASMPRHRAFKHATEVAAGLAFAAGGPSGRFVGKMADDLAEGVVACW